MNQTNFIILKSLDSIYHIQTPGLNNVASLHAPAGSAKGPLHEPTPGVSTSVFQSSLMVRNIMEVDGIFWGRCKASYSSRSGNQHLAWFCSFGLLTVNPNKLGRFPGLVLTCFGIAGSGGWFSIHHSSHSSLQWRDFYCWHQTGIFFTFGGWCWGRPSILGVI